MAKGEYYTPARIKALLKGYMSLIEGDFPWDASGSAPHYNTPHTHIQAVKEIQADIDRALASLGAKNMAIMLLHYTFSWTDVEIAEVVKMMPENISRQRQRLLYHMARFLGWHTGLALDTTRQNQAHSW